MDFEEFLGEGKLDHKAHAHKIRTAADRHHKSWAKKCETKEEHKWNDMDHKNLHKIADHVEKGDYKKAYHHMRSLDTSTKELIPQHQYNHIQKHGYN